MTAYADRFRRLASDFTDRVEAVPADSWGNQSPCDEWTARDVVKHMVGNCHTFLGFVGEEAPAGPSTADDPAGAWAQARDALQSALDDPAIAGKEFDGLAGKRTLEQGVDTFLGADLVVHGWDLARATGGDERIDPSDVAAVAKVLEPMAAQMRGPGAFAEAVEPAPGADEQTKLLNFLGREV